MASGRLCSVGEAGGSGGPLVQSALEANGQTDTLTFRSGIARAALGDGPRLLTDQPRSPDGAWTIRGAPPSTGPSRRSTTAAVRPRSAGPRPLDVGCVGGHLADRAGHTLVLPAVGGALGVAGSAQSWTWSMWRRGTSRKRAGARIAALGCRSGAADATPAVERPPHARTSLRRVGSRRVAVMSPGRPGRFSPRQVAGCRRHAICGLGAPADFSVGGQRAVVPTVRGERGGLRDDCMCVHPREELAFRWCCLGGRSTTREDDSDPGTAQAHGTSHHR